MKRPGRKRIYDEPLDGYNVRMTPNQARKALDDTPWPEPKKPTSQNRD